MPKKAPKANAVEVPAGDAEIPATEKPEGKPAKALTPTQTRWANKTKDELKEQADKGNRSVKEIEENVNYSEFVAKWVLTLCKVKSMAALSLCDELILMLDAGECEDIKKMQERGKTAKAELKEAQRKLKVQIDEASNMIEDDEPDATQVEAETQAPAPEKS